MKVTAETFKAVAEELRANDFGGVADSIDLYVKKIVKPDPDVVLAQILFNAWHGDGVNRDWTPTSAWFRVVAAARKELTPREPRTFNRGDIIPDDIQQVADDGGGDVYTRRENGEFSIGLTNGYLPSDTGGLGIDGDSWVVAYFPLVEVVES